MSSLKEWWFKQTKRKRIIIAFAAFFVFLFFVELAKAQDAHDPNASTHWYDPECCNLRDCAPIPTAAVTIAPGGFIVRLEPEDHFAVKVPLQQVMPYSTRIRQSQDDQFHACVLPNSQQVICLYIPGFVG